jgi:hypothetical protein
LTEKEWRGSYCAPTTVAAPGSKRWVFIVKKSQPNAGKILEIRSISAAHHT